jgi:mycofactocin system glycosyltransferase
VSGIGSNEPSVVLDSSVCRLHEAVLVGGSPFRLIRLSDKGATALSAVISGVQTEAAGAMGIWLVEQGLAHRVVTPRQDISGGVAAVLPVHATDGHLHLSSELRGLEVIVVDDASTPPITAGPEARMVIRTGEVPSGPASARNVGAAEVEADLIVFVDHDIVLTAGLLERLAAHFDDPAVVAAAPRIVTVGAPGLAASIEAGRCPLDVGSDRAWVTPFGRVAYVPTAVFMVRRSAFEEVGGLDATMRVGEDVDLCWRLARIGRIVYDPDAVAGHRARGSLAAVIRRRFEYGTSAGALDLRHPGSVRHADVSVWSLLPVVGLVVAGPLGGLLAGIVVVVLAGRSLPSITAGQAARVALRGNTASLQSIARYAIRPMLPLTLALAVASPRFRSKVLPTIAVGYGIDLAIRAGGARVLALGEDSGGVDGVVQRVPLLTAMAAGVVDDLAYSIGVWRGCVAQRRWAPLIARVRPGRVRPVRAS